MSGQHRSTKASCIGRLASFDARRPRSFICNAVGCQKVQYLNAHACRAQLSYMITRRTEQEQHADHAWVCGATARSDARLVLLSSWALCDFGLCHTSSATCICVLHGTLSHKRACMDLQAAAWVIMPAIMLTPHDSNRGGVKVTCRRQNHREIGNRGVLESERLEMEALSEHVQWDIISRLDWTSLARAAAVCRLWRSMVSTCRRTPPGLGVSGRRLNSNS